MNPRHPAFRRGGLLLLLLLPLVSYADVPPAPDPTPNVVVVVWVFDKAAELQSAGEEFDRTLQMYVDKDRGCSSLKAGAKHNECKAEALALRARAESLLAKMSMLVEEIEAEVRGNAGVLSTEDSARIDRILADVRAERDNRARLLRERTSKG